MPPSDFVVAFSVDYFTNVKNNNRYFTFNAHGEM